MLVRNFANKTKTACLIGLILLVMAANILVLLPVYQGRTGSLTRAKVFDPAPLIQALDWWAKTQKLEFKQISSPRPETPLLANWQIQILNGSGLAGAAAALGEKITTVEGVIVASLDNTDPSDSTIIRFKNKVPDEVKNQLTTLIKQEFPELNQEILPADSVFDIIIILGKTP